MNFVMLTKFFLHKNRPAHILYRNKTECVAQQEIVFKKDKATLHVISKRCEETKHF